jgi:hypothetical protein
MNMKFIIVHTFIFILHYLGKRCGKAAQRGLQEADKSGQGGERAQAPGIIASPTKVSVGRKWSELKLQVLLPAQPASVGRKGSEIKLQVLLPAQQASVDRKGSEIKIKVLKPTQQASIGRYCRSRRQVMI